MTHVTLFSFDRIPFNRGANGLRIPRIRTGMSLNLTDNQIHGLIAYARGKFAGEPYPFAPALRPIRKLDPKTPEPCRHGSLMC